MKRFFITVLSLLLVFSMLLVGCNEETPESNDNNNNNNNNKQPATEAAPFTKTEAYMPAEISAQMKEYFENATTGFQVYDNRDCAPFVSTDVFAISDCTVKSITIPVFSTSTTDADGDFTFSLYILPNDWADLKATLADTPDPIEIKINAEEHGLEENKVIRKFVKVDLSEYDIQLSKNETLGFSGAADTLVPARVLTTGTEQKGGVKQKYAPAKYLIDNWDVVGYYYYDTSFTYADDALLFDLELERTYESEAAYNALIAAQAQADADYAMKIAALKEAYAGKYISVMGDSISTFNTISNDASLGLGNNSVYSKYTLGASVYSYTRTYWGKLADETDMELCVINSWGAGKVYGWNKTVSTNKSFNYKDNMLLRSYNLANDTQDPDLILLNFGINDTAGSWSSIHASSSSKYYTANLPTGDLYQRLSDPNKTKTDKEIVAEWFAEVEAYAEQGGFDPNDPNTITFDTSTGKSNIYTTWEAAYALSLKNIKRLYPDAEIVCITLPDRNHSSSEQPRLDKANLLITALAEYFEVSCVDQSTSGVTRENCIMYASDETGLHPNGKGHAALTKAIVDVLYANLSK